MGAKTWMLVCCDGVASEILKSDPPLDRDATSALAHKLFPSEKLQPLEDGSLSFTSPGNDELIVGCFPGLSIIAAKEFAIDRPSKLQRTFIEQGRSGSIHLHAMHSVVDWFAYAIWQNGQLQRSLSVSPDNGIMENIGNPLPFEAPYWAGVHPAIEPDEEDSDYPLPFHPLELGEAALLDLFGYQLEGMVDPSHLEPDTIPLIRFKRSRSWWKRW